jgi:putative endonuclease
MTESALTARSLGIKGEEIALRHLKKRKYRIVERGFRFLRGEIDIIAYDEKTLVFVEVKSRTGMEYGLPEESVTAGKQRQIRKIALGYLAARDLGDADCRFDVVSVLFGNDGSWTLTHYVDAF